MYCFVLAIVVGSFGLLDRLLYEDVPPPDNCPAAMGPLSARYGYRERDPQACCSKWGVPLDRPVGTPTYDIRILVGYSDSTVSPAAVNRIINQHHDQSAGCGSAQAGVVPDSVERHLPAGHGKVTYYFGGICVFGGVRRAERLVCCRMQGEAPYLLALHYCAGIPGHEAY